VSLFVFPTIFPPTLQSFHDCLIFIPLISPPNESPLSVHRASCDCKVTPLSPFRCALFLCPGCELYLSLKPRHSCPLHCPYPRRAVPARRHLRSFFFPECFAAMTDLSLRTLLDPIQLTASFDFSFLTALRPLRTPASVQVMTHFNSLRACRASSLC